MKIRTRLLLFLLPTLIGSIALVSTLLAYNWYREIVEGFQTKLKSAVVTTAAFINPNKPLEPELKSVQRELGITDFYFIPAGSPEMDSISKEVHITPIYQDIDGKRMTGYAPILDPSGHFTGLVAADIHVDLIDQKFQESLYLILFSAGLTLLIMVGMLYVIANRISRPVQKLNNSALAIAAGQYGESIQVSGPREIAELANTLNTMSECLYENINRLKENSLLRERMYGEYECAMLLQHMMLQKNIDDCRSGAVAVKSITFFSESPRGLLLDFPKPENPNLFQIHMAEAKEYGFEGMYQLLTEYKLSKESEYYASILFDSDASALQVKGTHLPMFWSLDEEKFLELSTSALKMETGDFFFLFNQGLLKYYRTREQIGALLAKVLKVFASDGLETTALMLQKEIAYALKRKDLEDDIHLLCFQVLNT